MEVKAVRWKGDAEEVMNSCFLLFFFFFFYSASDVLSGYDKEWFLFERISGFQ